MELDVSLKKTNSQTQVNFSKEPSELGATSSKHQLTYVSDNISESGESVQTNGTTLPPRDELVLKSLTTGVVRSKDYADQLEAMIDQFIEDKSNISHDHVTHGGNSRQTEEDLDDENTPLQVLQEMHALMTKLETDKSKIAAELKHERHHVVNLQKRLDSLVEKRLVELPYAVQKEHEACAMDIIELQWHVAFKDRQESRVKAKLAMAEQLNEKLKNDMELVKESNPLLANKVDMESKVIVELLQAHNITASELTKTLQDKQLTEEKSQQAEVKAEKERMYLKKEIDGVRKTLTKAKKDLSDSEKQHSTYIRNIEDSKQFTIDAEDSTVLQLEKLESVKKLEEMQQVKAKDLEEKLEDACADNRKLQEENDTAQLLMEDNKRKQEQERLTLEAYIVKTEKKQREILAENRNLKFENQDLEDQLDDNKGQKEKDDKALERIYREIEKSGEAYESLKDEFFDTESMNKNLTQKVTETEERAQQREELLDEQIESLNHQVKEEITKRAQLQTKIGQEKGNIINLGTDLKLAVDKMNKKVKEVQAAVDKVKGQVEKMREKNATRQKQLSELVAALEKLSGIHRDTETKLTTKKTKLKPKLEQLKSDDLGLSKQIDQMEVASDKMTDELREMKLGAVHLNRLIRVTNNEIEDFTVELGELKLKLEDKKDLVASMEATLIQITTRLTQKKEAFKDWLHDRQAFKSKLENDLAARLGENENLAVEYYVLQQKVFVVKDDLNRVYQQQVELEQTMKNLNQVKSFQEKFTTALAEFFKYRDLYYSAELNFLLCSSDENEAHLDSIRHDMENSLTIMSSFLLGVMEGSLFREMKAERLAEIENETQPGNHTNIEIVVHSSSVDSTRQENDVSRSSKYKVLPPIGGSQIGINTTNGQIPVF